MMQPEPMLQPNVFPVQTQVVGPRVGQTRVVPMNTISTSLPYQHSAVNVTGVIEIISRMICSVLCFGVLVASAVAISNINDVFEDVPDDSSVADDRDKYRNVAGWLVFVGIAGLLTQVVIVIIRGFYLSEVIRSQFVVFGITCAIVTIILALALISGGIASAVNASDIQEEYIDPLESFCDQGDLIDEEICYKLEAIRNAQAASAALAFLGAGAAVMATVLVLVSTKTKRDN